LSTEMILASLNRDFLMGRRQDAFPTSTGRILGKLTVPNNRPGLIMLPDP
jgi:hypothetical protein